MITQESLKKLAQKFQTTEQNVVREYIQHLFLSRLYQLENSAKLFFKGGTALRVIYQSPRFSEDLDFTGQGIFRSEEIDDLFLETLHQIEKTGLSVSYREAQPTTGGYLGIIHFTLFDFSENMKFEVSLRKQKKRSGELISIVSDFLPPYNLQQLSTEILVQEKLNAVQTRKKPRDYYDLYFILRHPGLRPFVDKKQLKEVEKKLHAETFSFKKELSLLLPVGHHLILKNFKEVLKKEIGI